MRPKVMIPIVVSFLGLGAANALGHAELKTSVPQKNAVLKTAPTEVSIEFTEELNAKLSHIVVNDAKGQQVDKGDSHIDASDAKHLTVDLKPLGAGVYQVVWTSVSADDGHKENGKFKFTVAP